MFCLAAGKGGRREALGAARSGIRKHWGRIFTVARWWDSTEPVLSFLGSYH